MRRIIAVERRLARGVNLRACSSSTRTRNPLALKIARWRNDEHTPASNARRRAGTVAAALGLTRRPRTVLEKLASFYTSRDHAISECGRDGAAPPIPLCIDGEICELISGTTRVFRLNEDVTDGGTHRDVTGDTP